MNENVFMLTASLLWALFAAGIAGYCVMIGQQITFVTLADGRKAERRLPIMFRLVLPLAPNLFPVFRNASFEKSRTAIHKKLTGAGFDALLSPEEVLSLRILLPLIFGSLWVLFISLCVRAAEGSFLEKMDNSLYIIGLLWLFVYPSLWLQKSLTARHNAIRRALPFTLDLLTLSVEAGMDFMTALQRGLERRKIDALAEELIRVIREIQLGKTRREALRNLSQRVDLQDLRSVVNALIQADELGVSIGSILRIQADQIRQRRFERAEKLANEAPVKMLAPLLLFIFPAVFLILLGPVVARLIQQGF